MGIGPSGQKARLRHKLLKLSLWKAGNIANEVCTRTLLLSEHSDWACALSQWAPGGDELPQSPASAHGLSCKFQTNIAS